MRISDIPIILVLPLVALATFILLSFESSEKIVEGIHGMA